MTRFLHTGGGIKTLILLLAFALFVTGCADAGKDQLVNSGQTVTLDASASYTDVDGEIKKYRWKQIKGKHVKLRHKKSIRPTFVAPNVSKETVLVFKLKTVEKGGHYSPWRTQSRVRVVVMPSDDTENKAPIAVADANISVVKYGNAISFIGSQSSDSDGEIVSYKWLDESNTTLSNEPTFSHTFNTSGEHNIRLIVTDNDGEEGKTSVTITVEIPIFLESISVSPNPIELRVGTTVNVSLNGSYSDGSNVKIQEAIYSIDDASIIAIDTSGKLQALKVGSTSFRVEVASVYSALVFVTVGAELNTTNFYFTNFGSTYTNQIPVNATLDQYDEKRFCMIAGQIKAEDGSPLQGVKVSIHQHDEYGSALTDSNGTYVIPSEGGLQLTMRYSKNGYTTIDRKVYAPVQDWVRSPDVTMLQIDSKVTQIDLANNTAQLHSSTIVTDDRGARATTLVFDGVSRATVTMPNGAVRILTDIAVRATEFKTPASMPSDLPKESAYTYCSDLSIDGVSDDEEVTFDAPVVMYVDNFLGFEVGEIVPVGYYDRIDGKWKASDNGAVIKLLDTDSDGVVDALDSTGDDLPNDLDGDGSYEDEVAGLQDNPEYVAGKTYWRAEMMHFTPWDHNWPYGPPEDAEEPDQEDPKTDNDEENDCKVNVSSYVTSKSRVFHEDIAIAGTDITLHYASNRVEGYSHTIDASVNTANLPASVQSATVILNVAGRSFTKKPELTELNNLKFIWDGKDALGNIVSGAVTATIKVSYTYQVVYLRGTRSFTSAWARVGGSSTGVRGRSTIQVFNSKSIKINVNASQDINSHVANGWTLSNIHSLGTRAIYKGDGTRVEKEISFLDGLVAYYKFDGDAKDSSFYQKHGIMSGGVDFIDGLIGKAAEFNGIDGEIDLGIEDSDYESMSFWTYLSVDNEYITSFGNGNGSHRFNLKTYTYDDNGIMRPLVSGQWRSGCCGGPWDYYQMKSSSIEVVEDGWHHIYVKRNRTVGGSPTVYIDGQPTEHSSSKNVDPNRTFSHTIAIGYWTWNQQNKGYEVGLIDELRVYDSALSLEKVLDLFNNGKYGIQPSNIDSLDVSDYDLEYRFNFNGKHLSTNVYPDKKVLETYTYDINGYIETITDNFNQTTSITRDANGNPTSITAPNGQITTLTVDENNNLTQVSYEDNSKYEFTYFDGSLMDIMIDPNGNTIQHIWNDIGRIVEEVDGEGGSYKFLRNVTGNETFYSTILPEGETSTSSDVTLSNGDTQSTMTLATGKTVTATFAKNEKSTSSLRDGVATTYTYTSDTLTHQKVLASKETTQPSGLKSTSTYTTTYDGNKTHTNTKTQTIVNNAKTTTLVTDYNNGTSTLTTPTGRTATSNYDVNTLLTSQSSSGTLAPTTYTYDAKGRVTKELTGTRETTYTYDSRGNIATYTNPRGETTAYQYDIVDNLTTITYPNNTTEHFSYDKNRNLLTRTVPTPTDHTFSYNGTDNRTNYTSPLNKATTYSYDKSKNITAITKPSGKAITNTYSNGRLDNTVTTEGMTSYSYLFANKVGSISNGSEKFTFTYDGTLVTSIVQSGLLSHTTNFTYNNDFQVTSTTYAGITENYSYDNDGLLLTSGDYTLTRDPQNAYTTQVTDGTLTQNRTYNNFGEVTEVSDNTFTYELSQRDNAGAIVQKKETLNGVTETFDYTFDKMGRLVEACRVGIPTHQGCETYSYDANGNRASATVNGVTTTASYTLDDQLVVYGDNTYLYSEDGYLKTKTTPDGTSTYNYGTMGELLSVTTPTKTITYKHNANNQRVAKLVDGTVTEKYLWANLTTLLAVYDNNDNLVQRFEYTDQRMPVSMTKGSDKYYLHYDQVGSLRAVTDNTHTIVKEIVYDTYGNVLSDSNEAFTVPFGFAGGLYDSDTELTRFGYRDYDAYTGKWTAKDPIGFSGEDSNLYGYVWNDPVNWIDPTGEVAHILFICMLGWGVNTADAPELGNPSKSTRPVNNTPKVKGPKKKKGKRKGGKRWK